MENELAYSLTERLFLVSQGNENAFRAIYDQYRSRIYSYVLPIVNAEAIAEDVVQEVFLKVWLNRKTLFTVENFQAWLYAVARNHVFDTLKKLAKEQKLKMILAETISLLGDDADVGLRTTEGEKFLQKAIDLLTQQQKEVFYLSRVEKLKQEEIATRLGVSLNTVKSHMVSALRTIKLFLKQYDITLAVLLILISEDSRFI